MDGYIPDCNRIKYGTLYESLALVFKKFLPLFEKTVKTHLKDTAIDCIVGAKVLNIPYTYHSISNKKIAGFYSFHHTNYRCLFFVSLFVFVFLFFF